MAPEMNSGFSSKGYEGTLVDMFALGVTFFITVFGIPPFHSTDDSENNYKMFHIFQEENRV
jgi:serine/threonine protein kinase